MAKAKKMTVEMLLKNGYEYDEQTKNLYDLAIADFTAALKIEPDNATVLCNRGCAYYRMGNYDSAISDCTAALKIEPDNADALIYRGWAYYDKADYDNAISDYTAALKIKPDAAHNLIDRGNAYKYNGKYALACTDYEAALRIYPPTVVVVNRTHIAIALRYERGEDRVPVVVGKGTCMFAKRIRKLAIENNIPIIENKSLVSEMYDIMEVGDYLLNYFFHPVAEILALVFWQRKGKKKKNKRGKL